MTPTTTTTCVVVVVVVVPAVVVVPVVVVVVCLFWQMTIAYLTHSLTPSKENSTEKGKKTHISLSYLLTLLIWRNKARRSEGMNPFFLKTTHN